MNIHQHHWMAVAAAGRIKFVRKNPYDETQDNKLIAEDMQIVKNCCRAIAATRRAISRSNGK